MSDTISPDWFRALVESTPDVYFRYQLAPARRFEYLSPSIETLTGHPRSAFEHDPALCFGLVLREDRRLLRQILRASRGLSLTLHVRRGRAVVPVEVQTVAVVRNRRLVAIEGVARTLEMPLFTHGASLRAHTAESGPTQQRLVALMGEVHALLHRALPLSATSDRVLRLGELSFDLDRLSASEQGSTVMLTHRERLVLRHLLQHAGRILTREQILAAVWGDDFDGNDRTVDVHVSRLRSKLPSLRARLATVKGIGYRLEADSLLPKAASY